MHILVTGGAGYIGSHTVLELLNAGHTVTVIDNLYNSKYEALRRVQELAGKTVNFCNVDLLDQAGLESVFASAEIDAVIHFAALKAVGESVAKPLMYYRNNVTGTLNLVETMLKFGVKNIVFSSSCTVYGIPEDVPVREDAPRSAINPYGRTKLMMEDILSDVHVAHNDWNIILLRYFNPIGAHPSGKIGEDPNGVPNNLVPYIAQVAVGKRDKLRVWGDDYDTPDGTGVRDYIHVVDLAIGHLKALDKLESDPGLAAYNLGTGRGYSVLEVHAAFEKACGKEIPYELLKRRPGDAAMVYADPAFAEQELGWTAQYDIDQMCEDAWRWQSQNPNGFEE